MPSGLVCKTCALTVNRNFAFIVCAGCKKATIHFSGLSPTYQLNRPTQWKCYVCVNMSCPIIDRNLKIVNVTISKIDLLIRKEVTS